MPKEKKIRKTNELTPILHKLMHNALIHVFMDV
jgi:hypothetical protein